MYLSWKTPAIITTPEAVSRVFATNRGVYGKCVPLIATSGAFDPLHVGHIRCLQSSAMLKGDNGLFVVIVNGDGFLKRKKGYVFMPLAERMEIIASIRGIDYIVPWDDECQSVVRALDIIQPNVFTKGGDKSASSTPEIDICNKIGCSVVFGIGGNKQTQSSSSIVSKFQEHRDSHSSCSEACCMHTRSIGEKYPMINHRDWPMMSSGSVHGYR